MLILNHHDGMRFFKEGLHTGILFDDCTGWDDKTREEVIKLIDSEGPTTHNVKHGSVIINKATPRIIVMNPPLPKIFTKEDGAIQGRYILHTLKGSLIPTL